MKSYLSHINSPTDLRKISKSNLPELAHEIREFILDVLSIKAGHLGASLGVVELSIALHYYFNTPDDLLIWDVGHQAYAHKILTGRKDKFDTLRQLTGISGFPVIDESIYDAFGTGHSSTSISAIIGMAMANSVNQIQKQHIAVIGDASITSGMALEALNHLGDTNLNVLIILNDNSIGIDPTTGVLKNHFLDLQQHNIPSIFETFGLHYYGVVNGHDFDELFNAFNHLESIHQPKVLHIKTTKGKGYEKAEKDQVKWHAPGVFNKATGNTPSKLNSVKTYQEIFGNTLVDLMSENPKITAITPAMLSGSNLLKAKGFFPDRVFDVGISEQHAVTFSAGLATQGIVPFCIIYSTFLQRAYDQIIHDVALQNLPVVFCIDRAGIVGADGATHHGYFDISFLQSIPNLIVAEPSNEQEFRNLLYTAQFEKQPIAIRFPRGNATSIKKYNDFEKVDIGKAQQMKDGDEIAILTFGTTGNKIERILQNINDPKKYAWFSFVFSKPLDYNLLQEIFHQYKKIITLENGIINGGFGNAINSFAQQENYNGNIKILGYPDAFIPHGSTDELNKLIGLDEKSIQQILQDF